MPRPQPFRLRPATDAYLPFRGGLDQETAAWDVKPGRVRESQNYEVAIGGGYEDVRGYERFDGRAAPSESTYAILNVTITGSVEVGDTVTGADTAATGYVVAVVTSGAQDYLVLTLITGSFNNASENLEVSASVEANTDAIAVVDGAATSILHAQYRNLAADAYRALITAVPGEDSVLGVHRLNDVIYAFRNATGGATAKMYAATSIGWSEVDLGRQIAFTSGGTVEIEAGDTIDDSATGLVTAVVERVQLTSGSWGAGDAAGWLILSGQSGTFAAGNIDVGGDTNVATIAGNSAAITLLPDGSYEFYRSNFASTDGSRRLYGCDGVNLGFEFDGTVFAPIRTGMTTDTPNYVIVHRQHLFFAFDNILQYSGIGDPFTWTLLAGANAVRTDGNITGFIREAGSQAGATLIVFNRNRTHILYGSSSTDFQLVPYKDELGAYEKTMQQMAYTVFLDDQGITSLRAAQEFGNFQHASFTAQIQTLINQKRITAVNSCIVRNKNQYRIFFSDGSALYITFDGNKIAGIMPVQLADTVTAICSLEANDGSEEIYFGSSDGFVYQMEKGTSFDGDDIAAYLIFHYTNDDIRWLKAFLNNATIEAKGSGYAEIEFSYELGYNDPDLEQPGNQSAEVEFATSVFWDDEGALWDTLFWDGQTLRPTSGLRLQGKAENISFVIRKTSDYFSPVRMTGLHYRYKPLRPIRS